MLWCIFLNGRQWHTFFELWEVPVAFVRKASTLEDPSVMLAI